MATGLVPTAQCDLEGAGASQQTVTRACLGAAEVWVCSATSKNATSATPRNREVASMQTRSGRSRLSFRNTLRGACTMIFGSSSRGCSNRGPYLKEYPRSKGINRSEEHTSELQSHDNLVCRLLLE